jgi:hypothetical protein
MDLVHSVNGMFKILDLISEQGRWVSVALIRLATFLNLDLAAASVCRRCFIQIFPGEHSIVNKIIISQDSLKNFINELSPGAYSSLTKVRSRSSDP